MNQRMYLFTCLRCSTNIFSDEGYKCFLCDGEATTNNGLEGNYEIRQQKMATSRDIDVEGGSRNLSFKKCKQTSEVREENCKRAQCTDGMPEEDIQVHKKCKREICAVSNEVPFNFCKPGNMNPDILPETIDKKSGKSMSINSQHEFLNVEKPQSHDQIEEAHCSLDEMGLSPIHKNAKLNKSCLQSFQKHKAPGKISDFEASRVQTFMSVGDNFQVQGQSVLCVNEHGSNGIGQNLYSGDSSIEQLVAPAKKKQFPCYVCDVEIRKHAEKKGMSYLHYCCVCKYKTQVEAHLQIHSEIHCSQKVCTVCSKEYRDGSLHDSKHACKVCQMEFGCKTLLDQHSVEHEEYFLEHCRFCVQKLSAHFTKNNGTKYLCCGCNFRTKNIEYFKRHNEIHRENLFCMTCKEAYPVKEKNFHGREWNCNVCGMEFDCKRLLEDHSVNHKDSFSSHCRICKETMDMHYLRFDNKYKCCFCAKKFRDDDKLQRHLYVHTGLRLFKCDWCEKRFTQSGNRSRHLKTCLPYKCKICFARFPCIDSHDKHRLEKHGKIGENAI